MPDAEECFATQGTPLDDTAPAVLERFGLVWDGRG